MRKKTIKISFLFVFICVLSFFLMSTPIVRAGVLMKDTSFRIKKMKAQPIEDKEKEGFMCFPPGKTIEVELLGSKGKPTSYLVMGKAKQGKPTLNWQGVGKYGPKTPVICVRVEPPEVAIINLDTILQEQSYSKGLSI
ncbi:MAG: hypothetical protein M3Q34_01285 [bacterium]|nr:hypothetical protein [bacterium]